MKEINRTILHIYAAITITAILAFTYLACNNHPVLAMLLLLLTPMLKFNMGGKDE